ncbi:MAG: hypothetical protein EOO10_20055 [Chitinophagaceae bacterium]|nr:MAG: hypothetical protein EOO10_20055 [Chitinophagaceae bacterium]
MAKVVTEITGSKFRLFRPGGLGLLRILIKIARFVAPGKNELYPAWQGMQYMNNMLDGRAKFQKIDNDRYSGIQFTTAKEWIAAKRK